MEAYSNQEPLQDETVRVAHELGTLEHRLERIEHALEQVLEADTAALSGTRIIMLQELDVLRQTLGAISEYLADLSAGTTPEGMVDASPFIDKIPLRDLAARLSGSESASQHTGCAELF
jgi:hypothetical protein